MSIKYQNINDLKVSEVLLNFVNNELLKGTNISPEDFGQALIKQFTNYHQ